MATLETTTEAAFTEITDIENNLHIHNLARFALDQHNKTQNTGLEFVKVNGARKEDVADAGGSIYYITLEAKNIGETTTDYEAQVLVNEGLNSVELLQLAPLPMIISCYCGPPPTDTDE